MIETMASVNRVILHVENFINFFNKDDIIKVDVIINRSVEYQEIKRKILEKIKLDFEEAKEYVKNHYEKCRPIYEFQQNWKIEEFTREEQKLDVIKQ